MPRRSVSLALTLTLTLSSRAADWPEFRGPDGVGHYAGPPLPTEWGPDKNVAWKTSVPGNGWSSPIVVGGKLFVTTAVPKGAGENPDQSLRVLCLDAGTGSIVWDKEVLVGAGKVAAQMHKKNTHASPTPASDGERVVAHFGHMGTACVDLAGNLVWQTQEHTYRPLHGNGGSPVLVGDAVVFSCDGSTDAFVVALDKRTGKTRWKTDRKGTGGFTFSFATCQPVIAGGRTVVVSPASNFVAAYDPADGAEVWRVKYPSVGFSVIGRPVLASGLVVFSTGYSQQHLMALDPAGATAGPPPVKWTNRKAAPNTPTPLAVGDELYAVTDNGLMSCLDAKTGTVHWSERLRGKAYSASPILANGLIYVTSEEGAGQVLKAGKVFEPVAQSDLKERTFATFVPAAGGLFVRTETQVYKFVAK